jgi:hypothetical protein
MMRVVVTMRFFKRPDSQQSFFLLLKEKKFVPVYIGDDVTDGDAPFKSFRMMVWDIGWNSYCFFCF